MLPGLDLARLPVHAPPPHTPKPHRRGLHGRQVSRPLTIASCLSGSPPALWLDCEAPLSDLRQRPALRSCFAACLPPPAPITSLLAALSEFDPFPRSRHRRRPPWFGARLVAGALWVWGFAKLARETGPTTNHHDDPQEKPRRGQTGRNEPKQRKPAGQLPPVALAGRQSRCREHGFGEWLCVVAGG